MERKADAEVSVKAPDDIAYFDRDTALAAWTLADTSVDSALEAERSETDPVRAMPRVVRALGDRGLLSLVVDAHSGGTFETVRVTAMSLARERLAHASPLLDLAFAMQGLGSYAITSSGSTDQKRKWLEGVRTGQFVAALALTEPDAGSDLGNVRTEATKRGEGYTLDGEKAFITNAGAASFYVVLARTAPPPEKRCFSAFVVPADAKGLEVTATPVLGDHPIGSLRFRGVVLGKDALLGAEGDGMGIALGTLHRFRTTVGAAATGFASRALDESLAHVKARRQFSAPLADLQAVQMRLADMATDIDSARLLVYRASAALDAGIARETQQRVSSIAKLVATEAAQRVIDHAVQLHGGRGVLRGHVIARLYDEVRSLRIYEGASDIQKLLIARSLLSDNQHG